MSERFDYRCRVIYHEADGSLRGDDDVFEWRPGLFREDNAEDYAYRMQAQMVDAWQRKGVPCEVVIERRPVAWERVEGLTLPAPSSGAGA